MICGLIRLYRRCKEMWVQYGLGRSPGGGHGNPLQYSCLENPLDREAWQATVHRVEKSWIWPKQLSTHAEQAKGGRLIKDEKGKEVRGRVPCQTDRSPPHLNLWVSTFTLLVLHCYHWSQFFYSFIQQSFEHLNKSTLLLNSNSMVLAPTEFMLQSGVSCSPITRAVFRCKKRARPGVSSPLDGGALSACWLPVEDSQVDGVDLVLEALESPESFSSRFWIFNMHQVFNSSTKDI